MNWYEILWLIALIITHVTAYFWGKSNAPEPYRPSDQAWLAAQCHAIDKQYEYARWANEHERTAESSDQRS